MENIFITSSLVEGDLSFWSNDLTKNNFQDGASLDTAFQLMDALVTSAKQDQKSSYISAGDQNNPLPDWMSEKIDNWPDVIVDNSGNQSDELEIDGMSPSDELLSSFESSMSDIYLPDNYIDEELLASPGGSIGSSGTTVDSSAYSTMPSSPDDELLAFSGGSIGSSGTTVNSSAYSTMPSSPSSEGSDVTGMDSFLETDHHMEDNTMSFESLFNSCKDANVFLQLSDSLPIDLPMSVEEDVKFLQESVKKMQSELKGKVKSESKVSRGRSKSKGVSKERKERKKGQNKEAATRYRQKKKKEGVGIGSELDILEKANGDLHGKVSSLEQEIQYLKDLLEEIAKVKGQIQILQSP